MFAIAVTTPGQLEVVDVPEPSPGPYEAKIRTELAALCNYGILDKPVVQLEHGLGPLNLNVKFHQWPVRPSERQAQTQLCDWVRSSQGSYPH